MPGSSPISVVLLGVGHTNAYVLRAWRDRAPPNARLTCVSNFALATYSGMLPGVLAGLYEPRRMEIDLRRLCAAAGAQLVVAELSGADIENRCLTFAEHAPIPFDVLSIGVGSVPSREGLEAADETLVPIKPMQTFLTRLDARLCEVNQRRGKRPLRLAVVGGGAGGVEVALCLPARLRQTLGKLDFELSLISSQPSVVPDLRAATQRLVTKELERRGVRLLLESRVVRADDGLVTLDDRRSLDADIVLWATSASPSPLLARLPFPKDDRGYLLTRDTLQSASGSPVFAVGDCASIAGARLPKSGVYAVRQGPILWENIQRRLAGKPLVSYQPQRGFLKLLNLGDGRAIGEYRGFSFCGRWAWWLKDWIDSRFMEKYQISNGASD